MLFWRHICSGTFSSNVKCMYTSVPGHTVDCCDFISGIWTDIVISYVNMNKLAYVAFEGHIWFRHIFGNNT